MRAEAVLAMHCAGIHALVRLLGHSEAFRDVQASCQSVEPGHWPLNGQITEGLFTALLMLSERAAALSQSLPDTSDASLVMRHRFGCNGETNHPAYVKTDIDRVLTP